MRRFASWAKAAAPIILVCVMQAAKADAGFDGSGPMQSTSTSAKRAKSVGDVLGASVVARQHQALERMVIEAAGALVPKELSVAELFALAQHAYEARDWSKAQAWLTLVLERDALWPQAWLRMGNALQQASDHSGAMRAYRRCVELSASGDRTLGHKALTNIAGLQLERLDEAVAELERWAGIKEAPARAALAQQSSESWRERIALAREQPAALVPAVSQERVPVYQGWSARRQPGKRQLALPPEDVPAAKQAPSKPVLRGTTGVRPALPRLQSQDEMQAAAPEVIYLKGGESGSAGTKPAESRPK